MSAVPVPCVVCECMCWNAKNYWEFIPARRHTAANAKRNENKNFFLCFFFAHNFISTNSTVCNVSVAFPEEKWWLVFEEAAAPSMMEEKYIKKNWIWVLFSHVNKNALKLWKWFFLRHLFHFVSLLKTGDSCSFCWFPTRQPVHSFRFVFFSFLSLLLFFSTISSQQFCTLMNVPLEL